MRFWPNWVKKRMNKKINFADLVNIYKQTKFNAKYTVGSLNISTDELRLCIINIVNNKDESGITLESGEIELGNNVTLHFIPPKLKLGQLHVTFDDYLKNSKNRIKEANSYYILSESYYNKDEHHPQHIINYRMLLRLISLFKESAAYLDETNCELVFLETNVTKIPIIFDAKNVQTLDHEKVNNFIALFAQDTHRDQKLTILANTIKSMCDTKNKDSAFAYLINEIPQLNDSFNKGYNLYVSGFSYDKILDQLRVAKIEEMGKIHKVFSDIQNQILGIPVATLIVATQMKLATDWDGQALINTAVVLGSIFFTAMIMFVMFNQWQTLSAIADELNYKEKQAQTNYKSIYGDIQKTFKSLRARIHTQRVVFITLGFFVIIGSFLTVKFYFFLTPYARHYIFG